MFEFVCCFGAVLRFDDGIDVTIGLVISFLGRYTFSSDEVELLLKHIT